MIQAATTSEAPLPSDHRRWLFRYGLVGTAATNLVINAALAWVTSTGRTRVPAWAVPLVGGPSIIASTLAMLVVLPVTTSLICTAFIRIYQRSGLRLLQLVELPRPVWRLVVGPLRRGMRLAAVSAAVFGPLTVLSGALGATHGLSRSGFIAAQAICGVLLGALITPLVAMAAMAEPQPDPR